MGLNQMNQMNIKNLNLVKGEGGRSYLVPFLLVTSLFFLWGFAHSILDVLNKHFQESMHVTKATSAMVQLMVYGGYFLMAIPAGNIIRRYGYRTGVLTGLVLYGLGALLFIPGGRLLSFPFFLMCLFIIGCGLTCLETAANPYVTVLGPRSKSESRLNLAQSLNGLGWICGPLVGGWFLFHGEGDISMPYAIIGVAVLLVAIVFSRVSLPEVETEEDAVEQTEETAGGSASLWMHKNFRYGLVTLFLYVAAQTGINSFFINYVTENARISNADASLLLSFGSMGLFMLGRMCGSWVMARVRPQRVLLLCALGAISAMAILLTGAGLLGVGAFFLCYLCESIMFPTIFSLSIKGLGQHTKRASSFLVMSIVGGAVAPMLMGWMADTLSMSTAFLIPLFCFVGVAVFASCIKGR